MSFSQHDSKDEHPFAAVVLAADRGPADPVAHAAGVCCKALASVGGQPMLVRVIDTLAASPHIHRVILAGPSKQALALLPALSEALQMGRLDWIPSEDSPSKSAGAAMRTIPAHKPILLTTADNVLMTPRLIEHFLTEARRRDCDLVVGLTPYDLVSQAFPEARRTVLRFAGKGYCGSNLFAFCTPESREATEFWRTVETQRKHPVRIVRTIGAFALLRYVLGLLSLEKGLELIGRRLGLRVGAVLLPFAEAAIDVDRVSDWELADRLLTNGRSNPHS